MVIAAATAAAIDCGSSVSCFSSALARGETARAKLGDVTVVLTAATPPTATVTFEPSAKASPGPSAAESLLTTCVFQSGALGNVLRDVETMGGELSPESLIAADSCTGPFAALVAPMRALYVSAKSTVPVPAGSRDCGPSLGCVVRALDARAPADGFEVAMLPLFGLDVTAISLVRTSDVTAADVTLYVKNLRTDVDFDPKIVAQMKSKGMSDAQIAASRAEAQASARKTDGLDGTCHFKIAVLQDVLRRWYNGSYSTEDYAKAESCSGPMFPTAANGRR